MPHIDLFPTLRSHPLSRVFGDSSPFWSTLDALDAIVSFPNDPGLRAPQWFEANESDTIYTFTIALPGFKRDEVDVQIEEENHLTIKATRKGFVNPDNGIKHERDTIVSRAITLPSDADSTKVSAKLEDGLLLITVSKVAAPAPRKVVVN